MPPGGERGRLQRENRQLSGPLIQREQRPLKIVGESRDADRLPADRASRPLQQGGPDSGRKRDRQGASSRKWGSRLRSPRADKPFVTINCAALPETLVESELFGHEKGAFTGALSAKTGLLRSRRRRTLFIDEIGELPPALQPKLLRVLEDGSLRRLGIPPGTEGRRADLAATNRNMEQEVQAGRFREDLYYRINVFSPGPFRRRGTEGGHPLLVRSILGRAGTSTRTRWPRSRATAGRGTSGNSSTRWSGPRSWPRRTSSSWTTCRARSCSEGSLYGREQGGRRERGEQERPSIRPSSPLTGTGLRPGNASTKVPAEDTLEAKERQHIPEILRRERGTRPRRPGSWGIHRRKLYRLLDRLQIDSGEF